MPNLVKKVQNSIFRYSLFKKGDKILLAVSGGPDSTALLDIFSKLKKKYALELAIVHVNYGLRGKDSQKDEEFVRKLAEKYGFKIFVLCPGRAQKKVSENYLRDIRYTFFEKVRKENNFDHIAVAHTLDDQAETYLMRLIRGAGLQGLAAMRHKNQHLIRPLLAIERKEIIAYLKENKLKYRIDKTNQESVFTRNRIRRQLIPYLEKNFNPSIKKTLFAEAISIAADYALLSELTEKAGRQFQEEISVSKLLKLHPALQRMILRRAIRDRKGDLKDINIGHLEEILKAAKSTKGKRQIVIVKGLKIRRIGDRLNIEKI